MKHILFNKTQLLLALGCVFALLATSCSIREDLDACPPSNNGSCVLTLQVLDPEDGGDVTESGEFVTNATVYTYGEDGELLKVFNLSDADIRASKEMVIDNYPAGKKITAVGWGNIAGGKQSVEQGNTIDDLTVSLKSEAGRATHPDSLYFGRESFTAEIIAGEKTVYKLPIDMVVGSVYAHTINFDRALLKAGVRADEYEDGMFQFQINKTLSEFDSQGTLRGDSVYYDPDGTFDGKEWNIYSENKRTAMPGEMLNASAILLGENIGDAEGIDPVTGKPYVILAKNDTEFVIEWNKDGDFVGIRAIVHPWGRVDQVIEW